MATTGQTDQTIKTFVKNGGEEVSRTRCEIYTRVMGYYRPVTQFNNGKKSEFYSRNYFQEGKTLNSKFMDKFQAETIVVPVVVCEAQESSVLA